MGTHPNTWGRVWHHEACQPSLTGQTCTSACHNGQFFTIFTSYVGDMPCLMHITETLHHYNAMLFHDAMTSLVTSSPMHVQQVVWPFGIKVAAYGRMLVLLPKTFKRLDCSKHAQVATHQAGPCDWSLLPSTVLSTFSYLCYLLCMFQYMHSSVPKKPGSATHSSTSIASAGLLCLLVGALVHYVRSHK